MSDTQSWFTDVGMKSKTRFGKTGSPWLESVVLGFLILLRTLSPCRWMRSSNRSLPIVSPPGKSRLYMNHSFIPPMPGSNLLTPCMYSSANASCAALRAALDPFCLWYACLLTPSNLHNAPMLYSFGDCACRFSIAWCQLFFLWGHCIFSPPR